MKKVIITLSIAILAACCGQKSTVKSKKKSSRKKSKISVDYANTITSSEMKKDLYIYASDEFEGRDTGEPGQKKAVNFLKNEYLKMNIPSAYGSENYYQNIPADYFEGHAKNDSENVLAYIEGSEKPNEILILSAHLDHVGQHDGKIYNGADDDGSGTVALLEIAEAFHKAKQEGNGPKRSILILHVTGEEKGLFGSRYYSENPVFPLKNTIALSLIHI